METKEIKTVKVGRFTVPLKGLTLPDWFAYQLMTKFGTEEYFLHWDNRNVIAYALNRMEKGTEEYEKAISNFKQEQVFASMWWNENVITKELIGEDDYKDWARSLYSEEVMPRNLWKKTSKKEYQAVVSEVTTRFGPKFIGESKKEEEEKEESN